MIGSFITRALVMVLGYAYPAYECYKAVEKNKPEVIQLRFWCQYWILVAVLTVSERICDAFISWVPMYSEAKLFFFIFLWYPKTKGTTYVYDSFFKPYVAKHEPEIDRSLLELRTRAGDIAILYWQKAASYGQTRIYDILQFVTAQSTPSPRPTQQRPGPEGNVRKPAATNRQPAVATKPQDEEPPSPASSTSSTQLQKELQEELVSPKVPKVASLVAGLNNQKANSKASLAAGLITQKSNPIPDTTDKSAPTETETEPREIAPTETETEPREIAPTETEPKQIEAVASSSSNESGNPLTNETIMEESIRVTRGRLRKNRLAGIR